MRWTTTHPSLLRRLGNPDDHEAWRRFDDRYGTVIVRYARRRGLSLSDAEDVRQHVLVSLLSAFQSFRHDPARGRFRSYLGRVVGNAIERHRERTTRRNEVPDDPLGAMPAEGPDDAVWEEEWIDHHLRRALRELSRTFDPQSVDVFDRLLTGESTREIASSMNLTEEAVRKVRQRVRTRLQEIIARQIGEEDAPA